MGKDNVINNHMDKVFLDQMEQPKEIELEETENFTEYHFQGKNYKVKREKPKESWENAIRAISIIKNLIDAKRYEDLAIEMVKQALTQQKEQIIKDIHKIVSNMMTDDKNENVADKILEMRKNRNMAYDDVLVEIEIYKNKLNK